MDTLRLRCVLNQLGIGVLIVGSSYHAVTLLKSSVRTYLARPGPDPVTVFEKRFERLRKQVSSYHRVGYVTDDSPDTGDWFIEYFRTQYTLAPVIVDNSTDDDAIVGNFHDPESMQRIIKDSGLRVVSDFGNGVLLLAGRTP
jgi:hypothetical protein